MRSLGDDSRLTHFGDHPCHFSRYSTLPWGEREEEEGLEELQHRHIHIHIFSIWSSVMQKQAAVVCESKREKKGTTVTLKCGVSREERGRVMDIFLPFKWCFSEGWRQWQRGWAASKQQLFSRIAVTWPHMASPAGINHAHRGSVLNSTPVAVIGGATGNM